MGSFSANAGAIFLWITDRQLSSVTGLVYLQAKEAKADSSLARSDWLKIQYSQSQSQAIKTTS